MTSVLEKKLSLLLLCIKEHQRNKKLPSYTDMAKSLFLKLNT
jgi:hypothetical protein